MTNAQTLRFAVAAFDSWTTVRDAVRELADDSTPLGNISCLGLLRVLDQQTAMIDPGISTQLYELPFPGSAELIGCTPGPLAERLSGRLQEGAKTLQAALGHWLIGRHAAHLAHAVDRGKITVWVRLLDDHEEQRAYRSLLARSTNSVGVHDLVGT